VEELGDQRRSDFGWHRKWADMDFDGPPSQKDSQILTILFSLFSAILKCQYTADVQLLGLEKHFCIEMKDF